MQVLEVTVQFSDFESESGKGIILGTTVAWHIVWVQSLSREVVVWYLKYRWPMVGQHIGMSPTYFEGTIAVGGCNSG